jgi:tetratricopeptide (TPR) repeat protein
VYKQSAAAILGLFLLAADSTPPPADRLATARNLGKAFYENPTTQKEAVEEFRKALALAPDSPRERLNYGLALLRAGEVEAGIAELQRVQEQDPKLPHTWFNLGIQWKRMGETKKALAQLERMVQLVPKEPVAHYNLGVLYKAENRLPDAIREFEIAAQLDPRLAAPHFQLFNAYRQSNRPADAAAQLENFQRIKKEAEGAAIPEDMEWCFYAEILDVVESDPASPSTPQYRFDRRTLLTKAKGMQLVDGRDLLVWTATGVHRFRNGSPLPNSGLETLKDVVAIAPGDFKNDGHAGLCIVTRHGASLYRNQAGRYVKVKADLGPGPYESAVWIDYDHDYDLDLILLGPKPRLYRNQGAAGFTNHTADFPFAPGEAIDAVVYRVEADTKGFDMAISYRDHAGVLYRDMLGGVFQPMTLAPLPPGARSLRAFDLNGSGNLQVVHDAIYADLDNSGRIAKSDAAPGAVAWAAADFNGDGRIDLAVMSRFGTVIQLTNRTVTHNRHLRVKLDGVKNLKTAVGSEIEIKAGRHYQRLIYDGAPLLIGMGQAKSADTIRITWPNGLIQNEINQASGRAYEYKEAQRLSGSCPMIWTWNGIEFQFITDVLGVAPLGASSGDGKYFPVDHDEYIQIPGEALAQRNGRYELRITEELSEVAYLDETKLIAVDHPAKTEVYTNDKFKSPPFPEFRIFPVERRIYPRRAVQNGSFVLTALASRDRVYADRFSRNLSGVAALSKLDLEFPASRSTSSVLILNGWVDWADGSTFLQAAQESKAGLVFPYLQVKNAKGVWQTVIEDMGLPAGKPKTIAVDLTGKWLSSSREVRIVTNLCIYWDEIFLSEGSTAPSPRLTHLAPIEADLHFRGYSRVEIHPQRLQPEQFQYSPVSTTSFWNPTPGLYTRYGGVAPLLQAADDKFVIMSSGDELKLEFDASQLPPLADGWKRDFLLKVDGWAKDRDPNTAYSQSVEPLPFHGMSQYPYPTSERFPENDDWRKQYNTRPALRLLRPLQSKR